MRSKAATRAGGRLAATGQPQHFMIWRLSEARYWIIFASRDSSSAGYAGAGLRHGGRFFGWRGLSTRDFSLRIAEMGDERGDFRDFDAARTRTDAARSFSAAK